MGNDGGLSRAHNRNARGPNGAKASREVTSPERGDEQQQGRAHSQRANRHEECLRARWLVQFVRHQQGTRDCLSRSRPLGRQRQLSSQAARAKGGGLIILASVGRSGYTSIGLFSQVWLRFALRCTISAAVRSAGERPASQAVAAAPCGEFRRDAPHLRAPRTGPYAAVARGGARGSYFSQSVSGTARPPAHVMTPL